MAEYKKQNNHKGNFSSLLHTHPDTGFLTVMPLDPDNADYQNYLKWVAEGNTADPADGLTWDNIRSTRNQKLKETDWTQTPDVPQETIWKWKTYRQDLRDIPQKQTDPNNITWPTKPS